MDKKTILQLVGFGVLLGLGLTVILTGVIRLLDWVAGIEFLIGAGWMLLGSVLVMVSFGGAYRALRSGPRQAS